MALNVTYYGGADPIMGKVPGIMISRASVTLTASSASLGTPPSNAVFARLTAGEDCVVSNNGSDTSATNGDLIKSGQVLEVGIIAGTALKGMTA